MAGVAPDNLRLDGHGPMGDGDTLIDAPAAPTIVTVDPDAQTMEVTQPDGSMIINFGPELPEGADDPMEHDANLAEFLTQEELKSIARDLLQGIGADEESRREWLDTRSKGIGLLGLQLKTPATDVSNTGAVSTVDHPMLLEAVLRFQANARSELLPASGPVKIRDDQVQVSEPEPPAPPQPPQPDPLAPHVPQPDPNMQPPAQPPMLPPGAMPPMAPPAGGAGPMPPPMLPPSGAGGAPMMPPPDLGSGVPMPGVEAMGGNGGPPMVSPSRNELSEALETDLNHYLTVTAKEYYPDTDRMLLYVGFSGCGFKKVYKCPIRRRPVSESVDAKDLIVSNAATDMNNSGRVTHQIMMRRATLKRMEMVGAYRVVEGLDATQPTPQPNEVDEKIAEVQGVAAKPQRPEDADYTIYECYCELDIPGFEHLGEDGEPTGLPVPYVVVLEKDSREVLAIRRNYDEDDDLCLAKLPFVKYPFVPGLGFYDIGLIHILGNTTRALTAAWREMLDTGMFANFPGFLFLKSAIRGNDTNEFRTMPGQGTPIDSSAAKIGDAVMPLPYKDVGQGLMSLMDSIAETGARVGGTAEVAVGEGKQDAPVGTTIALMEQATKIVDAVHKRLHAAQAEEFQLLKAEFRKDPEALWRSNKKSKLAAALGDVKADAKREAAKALVIQALEDADIVPAADPNTPSHMHRIMKAVAIMQIAMAQPDLYDMKQVHKRVLQMLNVEDINELWGEAAPPAPSPDMVLGVMGELQKVRETIAGKLEQARQDNDTKLEQETIRQQGENQRAIVSMAHELVKTANQHEQAGASMGAKVAGDNARLAAQREKPSRVV